MKEVRRIRKKVKVANDRVPRWSEAETAVVEHILQEVDQHSMSILRLSNILRSRDPISDTQHVATMDVARDFMSRIIKGGKETVDALSELGDVGVIAWCPDNRDDIGRVCAGVAKVAGAGVWTQMALISPLEPRPGCHEVGQFTDTWSHELLSPKWAPFLKEVKFGREPARIVISGLHAPMHQNKSLCMVTLSTIKGEGKMSMMQSRGTIGVGEDYTMMVVDIREEDEVGFLQKAGRISKEVIADWQGPSRAPSSSRDGKRLLYTGSIQNGGAWEARATVMHVKERMGDLDVVIGLHSTHGCEETVLIELSTTGAAEKALELIEDAVLVTPTLMIARTMASEAQWKRQLETIFADNDNAYVERIRYRPSAGGGILAAAPAIKEQKDRKRYEAKGSDGRELQIVVRLTGELIGARMAEAEHSVHMMREATRIPLEAKGTEVVKDAYQWMLMQDARYGWRGDFLIKLANKAEVLTIFKGLDGKAISFSGGGRIAVEVMPHISMLDDARRARLDGPAI